MSDTRRSLLGVLLLAVGIVAFSQGNALLDGFVLDLGELNWPAPRHRTFLGLITVCGSVCALGALLALKDRDPLAALERLPDRGFLVAATIAGFVIPLLVQQVVLGGVALTDDEAAYRFGADLLLGGRVTAPSHPLPLHFDHGMMVNGGNWHPGYFLGWPALLAPFVKLGLPGLANPALAAITVPALSVLLEDAGGRRWGRAALMVWLLAPMPAFLAATGLSHTSCLCALAWTGWAARRSEDGRLWHHAMVGVAFSVAFFIRPVSALTVGGPLLALWSWGVVQRRDARSALAMATPSVLFALAFLAVNQAQNGSPWLPSYVAGAAYHASNGFRFAFPGNPGDAVQAIAFAPTALVEQTAAGLLRLNFAAFGWPCSLLFLVWARNRAWWLSFVGGLTGAALVLDVGFDTFGPVHYSEVLLPLTVLTAAGLATFAGRRGPKLAGALLVGLVLAGTLLYWPVRASNASRIAWSIQRPVDRVAELDDAVVFAMWPFTAQNCDIRPTRHLRLARPLPHPDLTGPVVWANHLTLASDRRLMETFPDRTGYLLFYDAECAFGLVPLATLPDGAFREGFVGGNGSLEGYR